MCKCRICILPCILIARATCSKSALLDDHGTALPSMNSPKCSMDSA